MVIKYCHAPRAHTTLPYPADAEAFPVLLFLSGLTCSDENAITKSNAQEHCSSEGLILVVPDTSPLLHSPTFAEALLAETPRATLRFGERARTRGLHVMQSPTMRWVETLTGLGGTGVNLVLAWRPIGAGPPTGHPMVPVYTLTIAGIRSVHLLTLLALHLMVVIPLVSIQ